MSKKQHYKKKKTIVYLLFISLCTIFVWGSQRNPGGSLVIIGGALQPDNRDIYHTFIHLGGGKENIRIAIIPAASASPVKSGTSYIKDFARYGVPKAHIKLFPVAVKDDPSTKEVNESQWCQNGFKKELADEMRRFNAVFFVGGDQERYRQTLKTAEGKDAPLLTAIREIYKKGGVIGGASAGAAMMSDPMICEGNPTEAMLKKAVFNPGACPSQEEGGVRLTTGLGFFEPGLVDQHFLKRGRMGRLIAALLHLEKFSLGIGIDEDTAAVYHEKNKTIEVIGRSGILIVDTRNAKAVSTKNQAGLNVKNIILHYLEDGDSYHMQTREFTINNQRKKIEKGKEYYKTSPLNTDILGKDAVKEIITRGLVDNRQEQAVGIAFTLEENGRGQGVKMVFRKGQHTVGCWEKINGKETYTALYIYLDIVPVTIKVTEK
ncbi:MAG: cyanophycinase [Candidatus Aminicenantes bacterium]|nr:cyanophycinase [Candidatus Aminicenantes bacterium]NIM77619.1 cyanophycinase [Candidatus Aminicenantes bacterium]NIN16933.1 cyanophycinase [Candidatus Aminicenantes bacterium]NIN40826.1 cyanophycinase [Candidatus Aminicenantes bacterium]NIN83630.1 cyanophycinase [Candidatus Aminicenantes bacterium]